MNHTANSRPHRPTEYHYFVGIDHWSKRLLMLNFIDIKNFNLAIDEHINLSIKHGSGLISRLAGFI